MNAKTYHRNKSHFKQERSRIYDPGTKDPYRDSHRYAEPTLCTSCGSLYIRGRWSWDEIPAETREDTCPACLRIADDYPDGQVELSGDFFREHREEIMNLVRNTAAMELREHPLERMMEPHSPGDSGDAILLRTTGRHLARRIGSALHKAYQGELETDGEAEELMRIRWMR